MYTDSGAGPRSCCQHLGFRKQSCTRLTQTQFWQVSVSFPKGWSAKKGRINYKTPAPNYRTRTNCSNFWPVNEAHYIYHTQAHDRMHNPKCGNLCAKVAVITGRIAYSVTSLARPVYVSINRQPFHLSNLTALLHTHFVTPPPRAIRSLESFKRRLYVPCAVQYRIPTTYCTTVHAVQSCHVGYWPSSRATCRLSNATLMMVGRF